MKHKLENRGAKTVTGKDTWNVTTIYIPMAMEDWASKLKVFF